MAHLNAKFAAAPSAVKTFRGFQKVPACVDGKGNTPDQLPVANLTTAVKPILLTTSTK